MIEMIIFSIIGLLLLVFAILIGIFGKIELLHSYHYTNVSENDTKAYTRSMGGVLFLLCVRGGARVVDRIGWVGLCSVCRFCRQHSLAVVRTEKV